MLMQGLVIIASILSPAYGERVGQLIPLTQKRVRSLCAHELMAEFGKVSLINGFVTSDVPLTVPNVLLGAAQGVFPWHQVNGLTQWFRPHKRALLDLKPILLSNPQSLFYTSTDLDIRRDLTTLLKLKRQEENGRIRVTRDEDFDRILEECARTKRKQDGQEAENWISQEYIDVYKKLHRMGYAHARGAYRDGELVAGFYGIYVNGSFMGESMFHHPQKGKNLLKLLTVDFAEEMYALGHRDIDVQVLAGLAKKWGGYETPNALFQRRLQKLRELDLSFPVAGAPAMAAE